MQKSLHHKKQWRRILSLRETRQFLSRFNRELDNSSHIPRLCYECWFFNHVEPFHWSLLWSKQDPDLTPAKQSSAWNHDFQRSSLISGYVISEAFLTLLSYHVGFFIEPPFVIGWRDSGRTLCLPVERSDNSFLLWVEAGLFEVVRRFELRDSRMRIAAEAVAAPVEPPEGLMLLVETDWTAVKRRGVGDSSRTLPCIWP